MAASEAAAAAGPAALASGASAGPTAARGAAAASGPWGPPGRLRGSRPRPARARQQFAGPAPPARELIQPSVSELSRAVRTNILCTVRGCGKILPNSPALNMHLVKSHRLQVSPPRTAPPGAWRDQAPASGARGRGRGSDSQGGRGTRTGTRRGSGRGGRRFETLKRARLVREPGRESES